jgi:hypothetical protein
MPRPLPASETVRMGHDTLWGQPVLAARIAAIVIMWNEVDATVGNMLAHIIGVEAVPGILIYSELTSAGAKKGALTAIARRYLPPDKMKRLEELLKDYRNRSGERSDIVHGYWGVCDSIQDALVRGDTAEFVAWNTKAFIAEMQGAPIPTHERAADRPPLMVYKSADFFKIIDRITDLHESLAAFSAEIATGQFGTKRGPLPNQPEGE